VHEEIKRSFSVARNVYTSFFSPFPLQIFLTAADPHEPNAVSCTINDAPVTSEVRLSDGDVISIGGRRFAWKSNPEFIRFTKTSRKTVGAGATPKPSSGKKGTPKPVALLNATPTKPLLKTYVGSAKQASERRNVSFGPDLSPERFDLHLPPASPVKRGGRPNKTPSSLRKVVSDCFNCDHLRIISSVYSSG
jgi:hypothetical protein